MNSKAFTLIELLVVIAIIGMLSSIVLVSMNSSREKARDAKRKSDLEQMRTAVLLYADDHNGIPKLGFGWADGGNGWATNHDDGTVCYSYGDLEDFLDGTDSNIPDPKNFYIQAPHDPKCGGCSGCDSSHGGYMYYYSGDVATLYAHLENPSVEDLATCTSVPGYGMNYCVKVKY